MSYLASSEYGQTLGDAKKIAKDSPYAVIARPIVRGVWDIFIVADYPIWKGQPEFVVHPKDRVIG